MSPEYMHCALLGVSKLLLSLWTDTSRSRGTNHNLCPLIDVINERIASVSVPNEIGRRPRSVSEVKHWKGNLIVCTLIIN